MKITRLLSTLLAIIFILMTFSETSVARTLNTRRWKYSKTLVPISIVQIEHGAKTVTKTLARGLAFTSSGITTPVTIDSVAYYQIRVLPLVADNYVGSTNFYNTSDQASVWYMAITDLNDEDATAYYEYVKIKPVIEFGFLYLPFKYRPSLEGDLKKYRTLTMEANLGATLNLNFKTNVPLASAVNIPFNLSLFADKVNKYNSYDGVDKEESLNGLSISSGLVFNVKDGLQIGLLTGADFGMGESGRRWVYDGRIWYSFGIGYKFLRKDNAPTTNANP